jgi:RNA polymerase-binding transcription factor DksA
METNNKQHSEAFRYSDEELEEFRQIIEKRLDKADNVIGELRGQIMDLTENVSDEHGGDWIDDSSINNEVEMLYDMMSRQQRYLNDLEHALIRIRNRSYGICSVTGALIDKRRLLAVPTTTKSLSAKISQQQPTPEAPKRQDVADAMEEEE